MKEFLLSTLILLSFAIQAEDASPTVAKSLEDDAAKITEYQERCETIKMLIVDNEYKVGCYTNYHQYGPTNKALRATGSLKIANYNLLHPGTSKALFKDYQLVAKIMNQYDIISGLELLATVGRDEQNNKAVVSFLQDSPALLKKYKEQREKLKDQAKIKEMDAKIAKLQSDTYKAYDLYRAPGYLRVLQELKKLDPSWGLILSPRGDSALIGSVEELVGFFYRANAVTPIVNPHCQEVAAEGSGSPVACFITLTEDFMGRDLVQHFARRPFMASFKAGNSAFTLVASHVVFTYSGDEEAEKDLMKKTFGVESHKELGTGINSANFARFAEVKNTLEFMDRYRKKYKDSKIMFMADMNLVSNNAFWPEILKAFPGGELLVTEASTLSPARYNAAKKETNGVANDYDHFVLDKKAFPNCDEGKVYNYYKENIYRDVESRYVIRKEVVGLSNKSFEPQVEALLGLNEVEVLSEENPILDGDIPPVDDPATIKLEYPLTPAGQSKMDKFVATFGKYLTGLETVKKDEVVADDFQIKERLEGMQRRVFLRQLTNPYYYRFTQEILSDHFPVALTCKF